VLARVAELNKRVECLSNIVDEMIDSSTKSDKVDAYVTCALSTSYSKTLVVWETSLAYTLVAHIIPVTFSARTFDLLYLRVTCSPACDIDITGKLNALNVLLNAYLIVCIYRTLCDLILW